MPTHTKERIVSNDHSDSSSQPCQHRTIAHGAIGHVSVCPDCSVLHLSIGHMSLRFAPDTFRALAVLLGDAQGKLDMAVRAQAAVHVEPQPTSKFH
jgi:hypothetical protein